MQPSCIHGAGYQLCPFFLLTIAHHSIFREKPWSDYAAFACGHYARKLARARAGDWLFDVGDNLSLTSPPRSMVKSPHQASAIRCRRAVYLLAPAECIPQPLDDDPLRIVGGPAHSQ